MCEPQYDNVTKVDIKFGAAVNQWKILLLLFEFR